MILKSSLNSHVYWHLYCTVKWNVNFTKIQGVIFSVYSDSCSISSEDLGIPRLNDDHLGIILKGTVSVITSDPSCKDGNARFPTRVSIFPEPNFHFGNGMIQKFVE